MSGPCVRLLVCECQPSSHRLVITPTPVECASTRGGSPLCVVAVWYADLWWCALGVQQQRKLSVTRHCGACRLSCWWDRRERARRASASPLHAPWIVNSFASGAVVFETCWGGGRGCAGCALLFSLLDVTLCVRAGRAVVRRWNSLLFGVFIFCSLRARVPSACQWLCCVLGQLLFFVPLFCETPDSSHVTVWAA